VAAVPSGLSLTPLRIIIIIIIKEILLLHVAQTGSRAHPASYHIGSGGFFSGGKGAGT
jgi:hypothetical protein